MSTSEISKITLPPPEKSGGKPLMEVLQARRSTREISSKPLPPQTLSNLLWAATGVNRPETGKRTAPSARDRREIDIYVVTAEGAYRYDNHEHTLTGVAAGDLRPLAGKQDFVFIAPVNLIFVADYMKMPDLDSEQQLIYSSTDTGFIVQNVYLFCASAGLAAVVRGSVDRASLGKALGLEAHQRIILAQTVAYPEKPF